MKDTNEFTLVGTIKYKPAGISAKIETKAGERSTTHEVFFFDRAQLSYNAGDVVTVTGHLGARKTEYTREHNGKTYPVYMSQLVADKIERTVGAEGDAAPGEEMP